MIKTLIPEQQYAQTFGDIFLYLKKMLLYSFEKSCLSHRLFVTLSSLAVSRQKGRSRVNNLDVRQSRQSNDSASILKRAKERFCNSEMLKKAQQEAK